MANETEIRLSKEIRSSTKFLEGPDARERTPDFVRHANSSTLFLANPLCDKDA